MGFMVQGGWDTEVFVVGGGPAGLAAAIAARQAGFDVTLADAARPPIDKTCGEGIMPEGLLALQKLGVSLPLEQGAPFNGIRFVGAGRSVDANFVQGPGLGVRRTTLHGILVEHAESVGVKLRWGTRVSGINGDGVLVEGKQVRSRWVIGADGENSWVRRWAGLDVVDPKIRRYGFRRHYKVAPWSPFVEVYWTERGQIYVTPIGPKEVCVAMISRYTKVRLDDLLADCQEFSEHLGDAPAVTRELGAVSTTRVLPAVYAGSCVLLGEASGSVDAITGDGLTMAFQQALALAEALQNNDLESYQQAHRRIRKLPRLMSSLMLLMDAHPWLRRRSLHAMSRDPKLFDQMLAIHTGAINPLAFGVSGTLSLSWGLLTA